MPELPEVETICNAIKTSLKSHKISEFCLINPNLRWKVDKNLPLKVKGKMITQIYRRAKYIIIDLEESQMIIHLGMTGLFRCSVDDYKPKKHDHFYIKLGDKKILVYNDVRKFGSIHWTDNIDEHFLIKKLGYEPLSRLFNRKYLFSKTHSRTTQIKNLIMNQKIVVGVGNIYACEALYLSSIKPNRLSASLTELECSRLVDAIKKVLKKAISFGGTSIRDFKTLDGSSGYFKNKLSIYGLENCKCGKKVKNIKISNRSSYYCDICQK